MGRFKAEESGEDLYAIPNSIHILVIDNTDFDQKQKILYWTKEISTRNQIEKTRCLEVDYFQIRGNENKYTQNLTSSRKLTRK